MSEYNYFSEGEIKNLDDQFVTRLDQARHRAGVPFIITSGYRTIEHNYSVGGVDGSAHTQGLAVDILVKTSEMLWHVLDGLYSVGFKRIGIYFVLRDGIPLPVHVHVDSSQTLPQEVVWLKVESVRPNPL